MALNETMLLEDVCVSVCLFPSQKRFSLFFPWDLMLIVHITHSVSRRWLNTYTVALGSEAGQGRALLWKEM